MSRFTPEEIWERRNKFLNEFLTEHGEPKESVDHLAAWNALKSAADARGEPVKITELYPVFGVKMLQRISTAFYDGVWNDPNAWFSEQFTVSKKEEAIINQWTFFVEHMGGPKAFEEWRNPGGENLVRFTHERFRMTNGGMKLWMGHMVNAINSTGLQEIVPEATKIFLDWCEAFGKRMVTSA